MIAEALSRTILLARTELSPEVSDEVVVGALRSTSVALVADELAVGNHAGQTAYITTALLLARCGHSVSLVAPNVPLLGTQPPLTGHQLVDALVDVGRDLLPDCNFKVGATPSEAVELAIVFGKCTWSGPAFKTITLSWTDWSGTLATENPQEDCEASDWPMGAMAAASLAAGEAFKSAMRKLRGFARIPDVFDGMFAEIDYARIELAPSDTPKISTLGKFDLISGGAVANAIIYALLRLPGAGGVCRTIDDDESASSNLNRNMLLRRSRLERSKVDDLATYSSGLQIDPLVGRYGSDSLKDLELAEYVLMGVDDVPSRWRAQAAWPDWLGIGATDRFSVQVSYHERGLACAGCLHPTNNPINGAIPTVAFVSFWSGLMLATLLLRKLAGDLSSASQQIYFSPLRPGSWWPTGIAPDPSCPVNCEFSRKAA